MRVLRDLPVYVFCVLAACAGGSTDSGADADSGIDTGTFGTTTQSTDTGSQGTTTSEATSSESTGCTPGSEGCACVDGECLGTQLACIEDICQEPPCTPDPSFDEDPENCGGCGIECRIDRYMGARCVDGACPPSTGECFDTPQSCDAACQSIGEQCVEAGCFRPGDLTGFTSVDFLTESACKVPGGGSNIGTSDAPCAQVVPGFDWHTCCCTDSGTTP